MVEELKPIRVSVSKKKYRAGDKRTPTVEVMFNYKVNPKAYWIAEYPIQKRFTGKYGITKGNPYSLLSRGGYDSRDGTNLCVNIPVSPDDPASLDGLVLRATEIAADAVPFIERVGDWLKEFTAAYAPALVVTPLHGSIWIALAEAPGTYMQFGLSVSSQGEVQCYAPPPAHLLMQLRERKSAQDAQKAAEASVTAEDRERQLEEKKRRQRAMAAALRRHMETLEVDAKAFNLQQAKALQLKTTGLPCPNCAGPVTADYISEEGRKYLEGYYCPHCKKHYAVDINPEYAL